MKRFYTIATALLLVAGSFTSCTKDLDEVGLSASATEAAKGVPAIANNNKRIDADLILSFSPETQTIGSAVAITVNFGTNAPTSGKIHLEQATGVDDTGQTIWTLLKAYEVTANGSYTYDFTSNVVGNFGFRAHYIAQGNNGFNNAFKTGSVTFVENCVQGMTAQVVDSENLGGNNYRLKVAFTLTTCEDYANVHVQGGLTAKTSNVSTNGVVRKQTNNDNYIIKWEEASLAKGTKTYYVTFEKEIKGAGAVTGDWTAKTPDGTVVAATEGAYFNPAE